jgi:hypothetical protein
MVLKNKEVGICMRLMVSKHLAAIVWFSGDWREVCGNHVPGPPFHPVCCSDFADLVQPLSLDTGDSL